MQHISNKDRGYMLTSIYHLENYHIEHIFLVVGLKNTNYPSKYKKFQIFLKIYNIKIQYLK